MKKNLSALVAGLLFGLGLAVSQMLNPAKVLGFLDLFGDWDPSLAFVMAGAVGATWVGYRLAWRQPKPLFSEKFVQPASSAVDTELVLGAAVFGVGWGLVGLCPGPSLAALLIGGAPALLFFVAMAAGMGAYTLLDRAGVKIGAR